MSLDPVRALIAFSAGEPVLPLPEMGQLALTALMTRITQVKD